MREIDSNKDFSEFIWNSQSLKEALSIDIHTDIASNSISTDSRTLKEGDIFIALYGDVHDAHQFVADCIQKEAVLCIVNKGFADKNPKLPANKIVEVEDTYQALLAMARYNRDRVNPKIIGITGSYGKTTAKELLKCALQDLYAVHATPGNYNNHLGLPFSLANMPLATEIAILEMGMDKAGEIEFLSKFACPDIAIITGVSGAHAENFSSISAIAAAKSEIFLGMKEDSLAIINVNHPYRNILSTAATDQGIRFITYGAQDSDVKILNEHEDVENMTASIDVEIHRKIYHVKLNSIATSVIQNTLPVLAVLVNLEADIEYAIKQVENFESIKGRGRILKIKDKIIIDDAYNASPAPMHAAIKLLGKLKGGRKVAVIGDMKELGASEVKYHEELCGHLIENGIDSVVTIGPLMNSLTKELPKQMHSGHFENAEQLNENNLRAISDLGDIFLFKASLSVGLGKVLEDFIAQCESR